MAPDGTWGWEWRLPKRVSREYEPEVHLHALDERFAVTLAPFVKRALETKEAFEALNVSDIARLRNALEQGARVLRPEDFNPYPQYCKKLDEYPSDARARNLRWCNYSYCSGCRVENGLHVLRFCKVVDYGLWLKAMSSVGPYIP